MTDQPRLDSAALDSGQPADSLWRFLPSMPIADVQSIISLGEGMTPMTRSRTRHGLWFKDESRNPTGSAKDRAMTVAMSKGVEQGRHATIIASTGSAGLSAAAYSARAGLPCVVLVPNGTPGHRKSLMAQYGAQVIEVDGPYEMLMEILNIAREQLGFYDVSTYRAANASQAEGPKTIAFEIYLRLGRVPDAVLVPVGGGGTLAGTFRGFLEMEEAGLIATVPRMYGVQNVHFNSLELALEQGLTTFKELEGLALDASVSVATVNLKHAVPPDGVEALTALRISHGGALAVTDADAIQAQRTIGREEGLLVETSSAVVLIAHDVLRRQGQLSETDESVALLTGSALRDPPTLSPAAEAEPQDMRSTVATLTQIMEKA